MATIIDNWMNRSELDYYIMFIKSWIPFNAWYMRNFYNEDEGRTSDRNIIDHIKNNANIYRDRIISLLQSSSEEGLVFRENLSKLHFELEEHAIPNHKNRISFRNLSLTRNPIKTFSNDFSRSTIKVEFKDKEKKGSKRFVCEVLKKGTNSTTHRIELFEWSMEDFINEPNYTVIQNEGIKKTLRECFEEINPNKPIEIIKTPIKLGENKYREPSNIIIIDSKKQLYFIDDKEKVSKVIIQMIYELRCKLFHGELDPTKANMNIYKYAYNIQHILIRELS